jgi:hypothetical protein
MRIGLGGIRPLVAAVLAFGVVLTGVCAEQEPPATSFVVPTSDRVCDEFNRSWVVTNRHSYWSIKVVVKWSAVGAKDMQEEIILSPGGGRAIGCASKVEIVSAEIMQF